MSKIVALTLPYAKYSFTRALEGISGAGYQHIGIRTGSGAAHAGERITDEMTLQDAERVRQLCAQYGLSVSMLFGASIMKEDVDSLNRHIDFAREVGADSVLWVGVWGYIRFPDEPLPVNELRELHEKFVTKMKVVAKYAEKQSVMITLKPHTGNTATGPILKKTLIEIGSPFVQASYDPGNVYYYEGTAVDAEAGIEDIKDLTYSLVMKDHHKGEGKNGASLPGSGQVDFVSMLGSLRENGFDGPLVVEKVHDPSVHGHISAEQIDEKMLKARTNVMDMMKQAGYDDHFLRNRL